MARIKLGDVFSINTVNGIAYFQFIHDDPDTCEMIRVLPGLYAHQVDDVSGLVNKKEAFFVRFPIKGALSRGNIFKVSNYSIPNFVKVPSFMRSVHQIGDDFLGWHITDVETWKHSFVKKLTKEQKQLSPWSIWGDDFLMERLAEQWTPEKESNKYNQ